MHCDRARSRKEVLRRPASPCSARPKRSKKLRHRGNERTQKTGIEIVRQGDPDSARQNSALQRRRGRLDQSSAKRSAVKDQYCIRASTRSRRVCRPCSGTGSIDPTMSVSTAIQENRGRSVGGPADHHRGDGRQGCRREGGRRRAHAADGRVSGGMDSKQRQAFVREDKSRKARDPLPGPSSLGRLVAQPRITGRGDVRI